MVAVSVTCAPTYCFGASGLIESSTVTERSEDAHGCCRSSEVPQPNLPASDTDCGTCLFTAGMVDCKALGASGELAPPVSYDLPIWLITDTSHAFLELERKSGEPFMGTDDWHPPSVRGLAARARLCVFLI